MDFRQDWDSTHIPHGFFLPGTEDHITGGVPPDFMFQWDDDLFFILHPSIFTTERLIGRLVSSEPGGSWGRPWQMFSSGDVDPSHPAR